MGRFHRSIGLTTVSWPSAAFTLRKGPELEIAILGCGGVFFEET